MFRSFKPKGDRVKAVQITPETVEEIIDTFMGREVTEWDEGADHVIGVTIPTLEGLKTLPMNSWIVRGTDKKLQFFSNEVFLKTYEPARVVAGSE